MGSWVHSILSPIYGDYHVIDKKRYTQLSCFNGKLLWWLHVLKHIVERYSFVLLGHPRKGSVVAVTPTSYSSFLPPDKECWDALFHSIHMKFVTLAISYLYTWYFIMDNILNTSAMIHIVCVCVTTSLSYIYTWWYQSAHDKDCRPSGN